MDDSFKWRQARQKQTSSTDNKVAVRQDLENPPLWGFTKIRQTRGQQRDAV